jgi:hypothetical protein
VAYFNQSSRLYTHNYANKKSLTSSYEELGFTVVELMVTSFLGLTLLGMVVSTTLVNRDLLGKDSVRTRINQNIRGSLDIIGTDIRITGENLSPSFPAIEIVNGSSGASDELVLRRSLLAEVLPVCTQIDTGTTVTEIDFAIPGTTAGCIYSSHTHNFNTWKTYRQEHNNSVRAFIYHTTDKEGEFFSYINETDTTEGYKILRSPGSWGRTYSVGSSSLYLLDEWRYKVVDGLLKIEQNRDSNLVFNVAFNIERFQVKAILTDGTVKETFTKNDSWSQVQAIEVEITGKDTYRKKNITKTMTARYFPRNILSH